MQGWCGNTALTASLRVRAFSSCVFFAVNAARPVRDRRVHGGILPRSFAGIAVVGSREDGSLAVDYIPQTCSVIGNFAATIAATRHTRVLSVSVTPARRRSGRDPGFWSAQNVSDAVAMKGYVSITVTKIHATTNQPTSKHYARHATTPTIVMAIICWRPDEHEVAGRNIRGARPRQRARTEGRAETRGLDKPHSLCDATPEGDPMIELYRWFYYRVWSRAKRGSSDGKRSASRSRLSTPPQPRQGFGDLWVPAEMFGDVKHSNRATVIASDRIFREMMGPKPERET